MKKATSQTSLIKEFNRKNAVINLSGSFRILTELTDPVTKYPVVHFSTLQDMKNFYKNRMIKTIENGKEKLINPVDMWLASPDRQEYKGRLFIPGVEPEGYYNFWKGFHVKPKKGDCSLYLKHIEKVICSQDEEVFKWVIDWMANAIQNPTKRPGTAVVLRGKQGTGKGVFLSNFGKLFGPHFVHVTGQQRLTGKFNNHLSQALFTFVDEGFWAGDKRDVGNLKAMITEEWITIEPKFQDAYQQKNYNRVAMASNSGWVVPADLEERRFLVLDVADSHMQDKKYFGAIYNEMNNGGHEALMHFLKYHKIKSDLRTIPRTQALFEQMVSSMDPVKRWWLTCLKKEKIIDDDEFWPKSRPVSDTYRSYLNQARIEGDRHLVSEEGFGLQVKRLHPDIDRKRIQKDGQRGYFYIFPELEECQNHFENQVGVTVFSHDGGD